jgi:uncharacterized protein YciI
MKRVAALAGLWLAAAAAAAQQQQKPPDTGPGGYEMTTYYVGFLYKGPKWTPEQTPETQNLQQAHLDNILRMAKEGKLLVAGPFLDNGDLRGLYIFKVATMEEAKAFGDTDPAIQAGRLRLELHPWYAARNITVSATANEPAPSGH